MREISARQGQRPDPRSMGRGKSTYPGGQGPIQLPRGRRPGRRRIWTDERVEAELRRLVDENHGRMPTMADLERPGLGGLRRAVRAQGIGHWAERLGLPLEPGRDRRPYGIADARTEAAQVLEQQGHLPGTNRLHELGHHKLARFIVGQGGVKRFSARYGIPHRSNPVGRGTTSSA